MSARHLFWVFGIVALSGCAIMTPEQCEYADWDAIGERDARHGRASDYIARRAKDCHKAGFPPDAHAYRAGWERGITRFCNAEHGFIHGYEGRVYRDICPLELEDDYLYGYAPGRQLYEARSAVEAEAQAIRELEEFLYKADNLSDSKVDDIVRELEARRMNIRILERELGVLVGRAQALGFPVPQ